MRVPLSAHPAKLLPMLFQSSRRGSQSPQAAVRSSLRCPEGASVARSSAAQRYCPTRAPLSLREFRVPFRRARPAAPSRCANGKALTCTMSVGVPARATDSTSTTYRRRHCARSTCFRARPSSHPSAPTTLAPRLLLEHPPELSLLRKDE